MGKREIFESAIRELAEDEICKRKRICQMRNRLYDEAQTFSSQARDIVKTLPDDQRRILEDYFVKPKLIADHECALLFV